MDNYEPVQVTRRVSRLVSEEGYRERNLLDFSIGGCLVSLGIASLGLYAVVFAFKIIFTSIVGLFN